MALKNFGFRVDINGISPNTITNAGTQGDHCATRIKFILSDGLCNSIETIRAQGNVVVRRFDVYDGEGGIWQSDTTEISGTVEELILEERHTRFGGKITVYLVITALSQDNETQVELYCFPVVLQLKNRPEGVYQEGENYESISGLAEITKQKADEASLSAIAAENSKIELQEIATAVEEKLKNGKFDGVGVESAEIIDNELIITYTNNVVQNLGNVKGEAGQQGDKGDAGPAGKDAVTDQTYNAESENAQSGKAVAEALKNHYTKGEIDNLDCVIHVTKDSENEVSLNSPAGDSYIRVNDDGDIVIHSEHQVDFEGSRLVSVCKPYDDTDAANKRYVDDAVKSIDVGDVNIDVSSKVDKINFTKKEQAVDGDWGYDTGVYGVKGNNNPALFYATKAATPNTVAVRDNSGSIGVSINIKDANGNNYVGGAAPHTWVSDKLNELNQRLYDFDGNCSGVISNEAYRREQADKALEDKFKDYTPITELNLLKNVVENKKITKYTIEAGGSLTLKKNALYLFLRDGSSNTISIYNNGTLQYAGTDNELTFETGIVIIPGNTMGSSAQYPPSYYSLAIKVGSGSSLLGIPDVNSAKFSVLKEVMESGGLVAKENSGNSTVSVWEIIL